MLLRNKDFKFNHMSPVVNEIQKSFINETEKWSLDFIDDGAWKLVVNYKGGLTERQFLVTENPFFHHIDMETFFDVLENDSTEIDPIFSLSQKEMIFKEFQKHFNVDEFISDKFHELKDRKLRFNNDTQMDVYDLFLNGKEFKYPLTHKR